VRARFWGTRGSIATPGPSTVRYGGNTSCIELRSDSGQLVLLDCGTGAAPLGRALSSEAAPLRGSILLGHTHWDHIQGLPFFEPLFDPSAHWDLYGPRGLGTSLVQTLSGQMQYQYFPLSLEQLGANVVYHDLVEGTFTIGDLLVRTQYLNHPALTLGYRIEEQGAVFCYLADHEPFDPALGVGGDVLASGQDRRHVELMTDADVVVHDAQYVASEYAARTGWGHSTMEYVVDAACAARVGQLVLFHHDPARDDDALDELVVRARERAAGRVDVLAAAEGSWVHVRSTGTTASAGGTSSPSAATKPAVEHLATAVVLALADPAIRPRIAEAAEAEALPVLDGDLRGDAARAARCCVLVVDLDDGDCTEVLDRFQRDREPGAWSSTAVLGVTRSARPAPAGPAHVAEWLVWPATVAHIRTKLRAVVLRRACRWSAAPLPPDEDRRLESLHRLGVLDTQPEERFDRYTDAVCATLGVPIALITLVDADRQWFKSRRGVPVEETSRDESVCAHAILGADVMQVPDLLDDVRFADNPAVGGPGRARFYAGAPLVLDDGSRVGTLCAVDHRPRLLDADQLDELRRLAREVVAELQRS
jgi:phosphoribosyl 1,2-cyclic phosphodiesterase/GAF domain-containing protein